MGSVYLCPKLIILSTFHCIMIKDKCFHIFQNVDTLICKDGWQTCAFIVKIEGKKHVQLLLLFVCPYKVIVSTKKSVDVSFK
jgi:hypothetical protein